MIKQTTYTKVVHGNGVDYYYTYNYDHSEPRLSPHIKNPNYNEWTRDTKKERHVYYEDVSKRRTEIINPDVIKKAGRPFGSKDSKKRKRRTNLEIILENYKNYNYTKDDLDALDEIFKEEK